MQVQGEWQARIDFFLVLVAIVLITYLVFKLIGPQVFAMTDYVLHRIADAFSSVNTLVTGGSGTRRGP